MRKEIAPSSTEVRPRWVKRIHDLVDRIGRLVSWLGLAMVLVTASVVGLRYLAGMGFIALQESVAYMHATLFMVGASYALVHDAHVRVDVFYRGWSKRAQAVVELVGTAVLLLPFCAFTLIISLEYVVASWQLLEGSPEAGGLPGVFLLKSLIPISALLLALAGVARAAQAAVVLTERGDRS